MVLFIWNDVPVLAVAISCIGGITCSKCYWYFRCYLILFHLKFYFTVNQWQIKRSPKIPQIDVFYKKTIFSPEPQFSYHNGRN